MPAPLYGADDPRRCSGNSVSEVLDKFRKNYDRIMSLPQETKKEKEFQGSGYMWLCGMVGLMSGKFARVLLSLQAIYNGEIPFPLSFPAVATLSGRSFF